MKSPNPTFYRYSQDEALSLFPRLLKPYLPYPNALYTRLLSPINTPDRHILYATTFPPSSSPPEDLGADHTILFCDRSRHLESHIWLFNPLFAKKSALTPSENALLEKHAEELLVFVKETQIPESSGWPFSPVLRFAGIHELMTRSLVEVAKRRGANILYDTIWGHWSINLSSLNDQPIPALPEGWTSTRVPDDKLDVVIENSSIKRHRNTLQTLPSACFLDESGEMVAWAFIGIDGSFSTLHVLEEYRGRGLAKLMARVLLGRYVKGEFVELSGATAKAETSGFVHAEVGEGNLGSEGVMKSLSATCGWRTGYIGIDTVNMR